MVRRARHRLVRSLGCTALAAGLTGYVLALLVGHPGADLVETCLLAQLPVLAVVGIACCYPGRTLRTPLGSLAELGARAEHAEQALAREHDRLHELRATIAGVSASHQVLHDPHAEIPRQRKRRLQRLHDAELDRLARLLADRPEPESAVDLDAVIAPLVEASALLGSPVKWTPSGCWVRGRPDDVTEALHVLIENAARHGAGRDVEVTARRRGEEVDITVTDDGPGVAPAVLPRIFERQVRRPDSPGDGLGLSIAQRLAQEMGGRLWLAPRRPAGPGATFVLTLAADSGVEECLAASV